MSCFDKDIQIVLSMISFILQNLRCSDFLCHADMQPLYPRMEDLKKLQGWIGWSHHVGSNSYVHMKRPRPKTRELLVCRNWKWNREECYYSYFLSLFPVLIQFFQWKRCWIKMGLNLLPNQLFFPWRNLCKTRILL